MRVPGSIFIIFSALATLIFPNLAVWNDTHIFSELWSPHARFHGAWQVLSSSGLAIIVLVVILKGEADKDFRINLSAALLIMYWACLFLAMLVPGTALADPRKAYGGLFGIPLNPIFGGIIILFSVLGYWFNKRDIK